LPASSDLRAGQVARIGAVQAEDAGGVDPPHTWFQSLEQLHAAARQRVAPGACRLLNDALKREELLWVLTLVLLDRLVIDVADAEEQGHRLHQPVAIAAHRELCASQRGD